MIINAKGSLVIQDISSNLLDKKSFEVGVQCNRYASIYSEGRSIDVKILLQTNKNYKRMGGKNLLKDIKNFICPIAGKQEASMVRKRLIGLQKIHSTLSNQSFAFDIR